jgi:hypothetical protein
MPREIDMPAGLLALGTDDERHDCSADGQSHSSNHPSLIGSLCREKLFDDKGSLVGVLLREKVAAFHRLSVRVRSPLPPNSQGASVLSVESVKRATLGPQMRTATVRN